MIEGGLARVYPVPLTSQPARSKALTTWRPRRPVAPVMRAVFGIVFVVEDVVWMGWGGLSVQDRAGADPSVMT